MRFYLSSTCNPHHILMPSLVNVTARRSRVSEACKNVIATEVKITYFDPIVGNGDYGMTLARGVQAVLSFVNSTQLSPNASHTMLRIANVVEDNTDDTSGAIFSIFLAALASAIKSMPSTAQTLDT